MGPCCAHFSTFFFVHLLAGEKHLRAQLYLSGDTFPAAQPESYLFDASIRTESCLFCTSISPESYLFVHPLGQSLTFFAHPLAGEKYVGAQFYLGGDTFPAAQPESYLFWANTADARLLPREPMPMRPEVWY